MSGIGRFGLPARSVKRAALGGAALWLAAVPSAAWATCAVTSGSGTVASPGANTTITCDTINTNVLSTNSSASNVTIVIDPGAAVLGNPGDNVTLTNSNGFLVVNSGALLRDMTVDLSHTTPGGIVMLALNGGYLENNSASNTISLRGNNARISVNGGGQLLTGSSIFLEGSNAQLELEAGSRIAASTNLTGPLIQGGALNEAFLLGGRLIGLSSGGTIAYLDAGDGDDRIVIGAGTEFWEASSGPANASAISLRGGNGTDTLELDGGLGNGAVAFSTTDIERLWAYSSATWQLGGSHAFQDIRIDPGATISTTDFNSLGLANSTLDLRNGLAGPGRLVIGDTGTHTFQHILTGNGELEFTAGDYTLQSASPTFNGTVINTAGVLRVANSQAFGNGSVVNNNYLFLNDVALDNRLSGNGYLGIAGTSSTLTRFNNDFSGVIDIASGDLRVTDLGALGNGNTANLASIGVSFGARLVLDVAAGSYPDLADPRQYFDNPLSGAGNLLKTGPGSVIIDGNNSAFSGSVRIEGGWLHAGHQNALGTGTVTLAGGGLSLGDITFGSSIIGMGTITKDTAGRTTMTGGNQGLTATWTVNAGTLAGTSSGNFGAPGSNIYLANGATLELTNTNDQNLELRFGLGTGTFRKLGAGRLTFVDLFSVGTLAIDAGSVRVNQAITANTVVGSGARLDGTGSITGNLTNNGTVAPGNSIGTLTVNGNYVHNSGSVLEIEFDANGNIDLLRVNGSATLNGGTLRFISLGGAEGSGGTFLTASGGITGTFATVDTVGAQLPLAVIYQSNSAMMAPSVLTARPSTFNAQFLAAAESGSGFAELSDAAIRRMPRGTRLWMDAFAADGKRSASGQTLAYGHDSYGLAGGVTFQLGDTTALGVSAGWTRGNIALGSGGGSGKQSSVLGGVTLRHDIGDAKLSGGVLAGRIQQDTVRNVSFNGFSASVSGETESTLYGAHLGLDLPLGRIGKWSLGGTLRGAWFHQDQDGYTEGGTSPLRLTLGDISADTFEGQAGFSLGRHFGDLDGGADFRIEFGGRLLAAGGDRLIPVSFAASSASTVLQGDTRDTLHGYAGAALDLAIGANAKVHLGYSGLLGATDRHMGRVGISLGF